MLSFDDTLETDHLGMLNSKEFGVVCLNTANSQTFDIIKTDAFILVDDGGLPVVEDKPMFNTSLKHKDAQGNIIDTIIEQDNVLTIKGKNYLVREVRNDGIGGIDIYLKDKRV